MNPEYTAFIFIMPECVKDLTLKRPEIIMIRQMQLTALIMKTDLMQEI